MKNHGKNPRVSNGFACSTRENSPFWPPKSLESDWSRAESQNLPPVTEGWKSGSGRTDTLNINLINTPITTILFLKNRFSHNWINKINNYINKYIQTHAYIQKYKFIYIYTLYLCAVTFHSMTWHAIQILCMYIYIYIRVCHMICHCIILHCIISYQIISYHFILYYNILYYTILYYIVLSYIILCLMTYFFIYSCIDLFMYSFKLFFDFQRRQDVLPSESPFKVKWLNTVETLERYPKPGASFQSWFFQNEIPKWWVMKIPKDLQTNKTW